MSSRPYSGILAEPIRGRSPASQTIAGGWSSDDKATRAIAGAALVIEKMRALCQHYDCDLSRVVGREHVLELGARYVPGFQPARQKQRRGRPQEWDDFRCAALVVSCVARQNNKVRSQNAIIADMVRDRAFGVKESRLKEELRLAKRSPLIQMMMSPNAEDRKFGWSFFFHHPRKKLDGKLR